MRHRRRPSAARAALLVFREAGMGLPLCAVPALLVLGVRRCFGSTQAP
ncbi:MULTISPECIES: hypothetical protein [Streptomyces]|nr:hypothetical protein [Streptomyces sp. NEAU-383]